MILDLALMFAITCFGLGMAITLWRAVASDAIPDRILALDTMVVNAIALLVLYGIWQGTAMYFEATILFAMTGFISTVAYSRYLLRGDIIE